MNFAALQVQHENQRRLSEALRDISENTSHLPARAFSHSMPDHSTFFGDTQSFIPSQSDFSTSSVPQECPGTESFPLDLYEQPEASLAYDPIAVSPATPTLQVDQHGIKVDDLSSSSSWVPTCVFADAPCSSSYSGSSSMDQNIKCVNAPHATVFAAAVTAAMIMENSESVPKRPRSPSLEVIIEDYAGEINAVGEKITENTDDNTTEASLEEAEDVTDAVPTFTDINRSPRAISSFPQMPPPAAPVEKTFPSISITAQKKSKPIPRPKADEAPKPIHVGSVALPRGLAQNAELILTQIARHLEMPQKAALSKKRRAEAMERFRRKKAVRCYGRKVRYQIRKRIATTRPRVNGRFARREDAEVQASPAKQ